MNPSISLLLFLFTVPALADTVKISINAGVASNKTAKAACAEILQYTKNEVAEECTGIDGKIVSWEVFVKPDIAQHSCSVKVVGNCDAQL